MRRTVRSNRELSSTLIRRVSRRFIVGYAGPFLDAGEREIVEAFPPGGFILFRRNIESRAQVRKAIRELRVGSTRPILVALDQEGGRVDRLKGIRPPDPAPAEMVRKARVRAGSRRIGKALASLGFDVDFAPVVDLTPENGEAIGFEGRTFGRNPAAVAREAREFLAGLAESGVAGCLKHFPGLGGGRVDSHLHLPVVETSRADLMRSDLVPFRELAGEAPGVMVSHGSYPALDPSGRPASLSSRIVEGLLGKSIGFRGAVFTDDLEMGALSAFGDLAERCRLAFRAGNTFLLVCSRLSDYPEAVLAVSREAGRAEGLRRLAAAESRDRRFRKRVTPRSR